MIDVGPVGPPSWSKTATLYRPSGMDFNSVTSRVRVSVCITVVVSGTARGTLFCVTVSYLVTDCGTITVYISWVGTYIPSPGELVPGPPLRDGDLLDPRHGHLHLP